MLYFHHKENMNVESVKSQVRLTSLASCAG